MIVRERCSIGSVPARVACMAELPMAEDKDRFGDLLSKKEKGDEERYAAEQDRLKLERLRASNQSAAVARGRCPICGEVLVPEVRGAYEVAACGRGHGLWLDAERLERMLERAGESEFVRLFRSFLG